MSYGSSVAKNAAWLGLATAMNKLLAFASYAIVARLVGPETVGTYFYGVSVTSVFVIISDLGMTPVVIRAIAAAREDGGRLLGAALRLKIALAPVAILAALGYGVLRNGSPETLATIAIACLVMTADTYHLALYGSLRGKQNLRPEATGMLVGQVLTALAAVSAALLRLGPQGLAAALLIGSLWNVLWAIGKTRQFNIRFVAPAWLDYRHLMTEAVPFALSGVAVKIYSYVDSLLIEAYHGAAAVGMYSVAYKMTYALQFLPLTFTAALYPALSAAWSKHEHDALRKTFIGSLRFMAAIGFALSAGLSALADRIIPLVYGPQYLGSIAAFGVLPWVLLPIFMDFPIGSLLNATHRAHLKTSAMLATMVVNVILNALLVPSYGPLGAAWAGVFSFWFLFFVGVFFSARDAGGWSVVGSILGRALIAAGVSWYAWRNVGMFMPFFPAAAFGAAVAVVSAFVLRLVTKDDVLFVLRLRRKPVGTEEDVHAES